MTYLVLARKWRPKTFSELVGQEHVVQALANALDRGQLHHAWLLTGTRGVGKTTIARILAKALNCELGVSSHPCGKCSACIEIDSGKFIDLLEMDAASNTRVDDMREVIDNAKYLPTRGRYKVYLIDEVHMLSKSAFNSMLKTLEEPPEHVKFILATTDPQKIPITVLSRCLQLSLRLMAEKDIAYHLSRILHEEQISYQEQAVKLIAKNAHGSMRDALSLLDQSIAFGAGEVSFQSVQNMLGVADQGLFYELLEALADNSGQEIMRHGEQLVAGGLSLDAALADMSRILHRVALAQVLPDSMDPNDPYGSKILSLASKINATDIQLYYQVLVNGRKDLSVAPDEAAGFMMTLLRLWAFTPVTVNEKKVMSAVSQPPSQSVESREMRATRLQPDSDVDESLPETEVIGPIKFLGDWEGFIEKLNLGGMARMLAQHCAVDAYENECLSLVLPQTHAHLLDGSYREKLLIHLEPYFKKVEIVLGDASQRDRTPVKQREKRKEKSRQDAKNAIYADPLIQQLQAECDATVIDESIVIRE
ncbi:MAG: DNA polymerase III subunit gamma/tau [Pseudomonadota bacterium]|nr:DNA polymerase III subunit gamma/tau [Pseudomonadota bacterium]